MGRRTHRGCSVSELAVYRAERKRPEPMTGGEVTMGVSPEKIDSVLFGEQRKLNQSLQIRPLLGSVRNKSKIANDYRLIPQRRPLETPEIDAYWGGRLRNVGRVRGIGFGLDDIGNRSHWMNAIH